MTEADKTIDRLFAPGSVVLAPMVRAGTLPMRLLALRYGADAVYGEELIAFRVAKLDRRARADGSVEFVDAKARVYHTTQEEAGRNVFQLGAAEAGIALQAASVVARDVAAIDLNMGCPKHFSVHAGMGVALMRNPEAAEDIIKTLRRNLSVPVTCKIRLLGTEAETVEMVRRLERAGAKAVAVHARLPSERPKDRPHWDALDSACAAASVPVIANGDFWTREDLAALFGATRCSRAMLARPAMRNPSLFRGASRASVRLHPHAHTRDGDGRALSLRDAVLAGAWHPCRRAAAAGAGADTDTDTDGAGRPVWDARASFARGPGEWMAKRAEDRLVGVEMWDADAADWMREYARLAITLDNHPSNTKYVLMAALGAMRALPTPLGQAVTRAKGHAPIAAALGIEASHAADGSGSPSVATLLPAHRHDDAFAASMATEAAAAEAGAAAVSDATCDAGSSPGRATGRPARKRGNPALLPADSAKRAR